MPSSNRSNSASGNDRAAHAAAPGPPPQQQQQHQAAAALEFGAAAGLASFLLTCLEVPEFARGTETFDRHLSKIYVARDAPHALHVRAAGDRKRLQVLARVARAN